MIYFDNAATSFPKPPAVAEAMVKALNAGGNPSRGGHQQALAAGRCVEKTRMQAARLFGCPKAERVAFTKNITEALNLAIASIDGHLVTTEAEHNSILRPIHRRGDYTVVPVDHLGRYSAAQIERALRPDTAAIVLGHASNLTGNLAPIADIGRLCRERDIRLILDTAQTAGLWPIDMETLGIDALCFTGHKSLYGPAGTGGICLSSRFTPRPLLAGGTGSHSFDLNQPAELPDLLEAGTLNVPGLAGLSAGLAYINGLNPDERLGRPNRLVRALYEGLKKIGRIVFYGDYETLERAPLISFNLEGRSSTQVAEILADRYQIAARAGAHCAPLLHARFGTKHSGAVRFSLSHFNTEAEAETALEAIRQISAG